MNKLVSKTKIESCKELTSKPNSALLIPKIWSEAVESVNNITLQPSFGRMKPLEPLVAFTRFNFGNYEIVDCDESSDPDFLLCDANCEEFQNGETEVISQSALNFS